MKLFDFLKFIKRLNRTFCQIIFAYIFITAGCIVSFLQIINYIFFIFGFSSLQQYIHQKLTYLHWAVIIGYSQWFCDLQTNFWVKKDELKSLKKDNSIVIANHRYQLDWLVLWDLGEDLDILQNFRSMAKYSLLYVPVIGWQFYLNDFILVKRKLEEDKISLEKYLKRYKSFESCGGKFWLTIFCEGTRFTDKKHKFSVDYAKKRGLKPYQHHLVPRTRGFTLLTSKMRSLVPAVFDATICFNASSNPTLINFIRGQSFIADVILRRLPMREIPKDETKCSDYLFDIYYEKDEICEFYQSNERFATNKYEKYENFQKITIRKSKRALMVLIFWFIVLVLSVLYLLLLYGSYKHILMTFITTLAILHAFNKILCSGKPQSTYGQS